MLFKGYMTILFFRVILENCLLVKKCSWQSFIAAVVLVCEQCVSALLVGFIDIYKWAGSSLVLTALFWAQADGSWGIKAWCYHECPQGSALLQWFFFSPCNQAIYTQVASLCLMCSTSNSLDMEALNSGFTVCTGKPAPRGFPVLLRHIH